MPNIINNTINIQTLTHKVSQHHKRRNKKRRV